MVEVGGELAQADPLRVGIRKVFIRIHQQAPVSPAKPVEEEVHPVIAQVGLAEIFIGVKEQDVFLGFQVLAHPVG